jgi:kynurenine formamidase
MEFYRWALEMKLKWVGVDAGCAEHPMNTPIRRMHENHFKKAEEKLCKETGKTWDEMFPPDEYYELTHHTLVDNHLVFVECIVGDIDKLNNQRAWITCQPIPFMG